MADVDDVRDAGGFAAQASRHQDAEETFRLGGGDGFRGKASCGVDGKGGLGGDRGDTPRADPEVAWDGAVDMLDGGQRAPRPDCGAGIAVEIEANQS